MQQQAGNEEAFEYNSLLRHGIFEAYSGILNGMSSAKCDQYLQPSAPVRLPDLLANIINRLPCSCPRLLSCNESFNLNKQMRSQPIDMGI